MSMFPYACVAIMCYFYVVIMFICGHNDATVHLRCYFYVRLMLIMCYSLLWIMCCSLVSVKFSSSIPCFLSSPAEHSFWIHGFDPGQEWLLTWFEWHTWNHSILARIKTRSGTKLGLPNEAEGGRPDARATEVEDALPPGLPLLARPLYFQLPSLQN